MQMLQALGISSYCRENFLILSGQMLDCYQCLNHIVLLSLLENKFSTSVNSVFLHRLSRVVVAGVVETPSSYNDG